MNLTPCIKVLYLHLEKDSTKKLYWKNQMIYLPNSMRIIYFKGPHCDNDIKTPKNIAVIRDNNIYDVYN